MRQKFCIFLFVLASFFLFSSYKSAEEKKREIQACKTCDKIMDKLGEEIACEHQLKLLHVGLGEMADAKKADWGFHFVSNQKMTIEEVRPLLAAISCQLLNCIYTDSHFSSYYQIRHRELNEELIAFRLAFWDEHVNRPLFPYLAQVRLADGNVYYHYADPKTQILQEPIVESLSFLVTISH